MLRFHVDFNIIQQYDIDRVDIHFDNDLQFAESLTVGMNVILFDSSLEVKGQLYFDEQHQLWYAIPDWSTKRTVLLD